MACYSIVPRLRAFHIEATLIESHTEVGPCGALRYDSSAIIAIGGLCYKPKRICPAEHIKMGAQFPFRSDDGRYFPAASYKHVPCEFLLEEVSPRLREEVRGIRQTYFRLPEGNPATPRIYSGRMHNTPEDRQTNILGANDDLHVTKDWELLADVKGMMANPMLWDPRLQVRDSVAHWPLFLSVGSVRGRSAEANKRRCQRPQAKTHISQARAVKAKSTAGPKGGGKRTAGSSYSGQWDSQPAWGQWRSQAWDSQPSGSQWDSQTGQAWD